MKRGHARRAPGGIYLTGATNSWSSSRRGGGTGSDLAIVIIRTHSPLVRSEMSRTRRNKEAVRTSARREPPGRATSSVEPGNPWQPSLARSLRRSRGGWAPNAIYRGWGPFMAGKISGRPWAEGFATGSTPTSGTIHKGPASSPYGRSEISPPMNRRNPAPRRMARCYESRCGTRGSDYSLNRLFWSPW
jgi:hypothetical protein